ncbi:GNAT family N-acetyltransferase [Caldimonas brevitalea]|uniref:GCN5-related N-acetyltransferase n=1 Tax=Caldimonas brevitalea TaxID=413882 RepID=A0A0G3BT58_9BURK|nr:GNAT family N-acetyltransferase [Caldimonas brevitalea]AKJ30556.1 GCN5-related N-acetyltransferase [Caldimonas brevitalea]
MPEVQIHPATPERRADLAAVFEDCGDARRCWCAFFARSRQAFEQGLDGGNKVWFLSRLDSASRPPPGVLAYVDAQPAGWCAIAPRDDYPRLARSRTLAPLDDTPVWSITCFVVAKRFRRGGLMSALIEGAVGLARDHGAQWVEAYPVDPQRKMGSSELYHGVLSAFLSAGFEERERRSPSRPIVRRRVGA